MKKKGFEFIEIMIIVAVVVLFATIIIPGALRSGVAANETRARATLLRLSTGAEAYARTNAGKYPSDVFALTGATPPFITENPCGQSISGYLYTCTFTPASYAFTAAPLHAGKSAGATYTMTTGSVLQ
ncbi:MAG: hypothetical protein WCI27_09440 [Candidatus Omnitrophota bacterium]